MFTLARFIANASLLLDEVKGTGDWGLGIRDWVPNRKILVGAFTHHQILKNFFPVKSPQYPVPERRSSPTNFYVWWGTPRRDQLSQENTYSNLVGQVISQHLQDLSN